MTSKNCNPLDAAKDICPNQDEVFDQLCSILPRGRAWQTHNTDIPREKSVLQRFFYALAGVIAYVNQRICALADEFFCETVNDLEQRALAEWGIPDECGLNQDLCGKIRLMPIDDCSYYTAVAASLGYVIDCNYYEDCQKCNDEPLGFFAMSHTRFQITSPGILNITYKSGQVGLCDGVMIFGHRGFGCEPTCNPVLLPNDLLCALERVAPAHLSIEICVI